MRTSSRHSTENKRTRHRLGNEQLYDSRGLSHNLGSWGYAPNRGGRRNAYPRGVSYKRDCVRQLLRLNVGGMDLTPLQTAALIIAIHVHAYSDVYAYRCTGTWYRYRCVHARMQVPVLVPAYIHWDLYRVLVYAGMYIYINSGSGIYTHISIPGYRYIPVCRSLCACTHVE